MADPRREKLEIILEEMLKDTWRTPYMRSFADRIEAFYAPAIDSDAELRGKLKELFAGEPFYEMSTDEVIDQILALIRQQPKPSPGDVERINVIQNELRMLPGPWPWKRDIEFLLTKLLAAWGT